MSPKRRGFTLIEILVVIVVIAILASLVAPNIFQNMDVAKDASARPQNEMLGAALDAYRLDNGKYPPGALGLALNTSPSTDPLRSAADHISEKRYRSTRGVPWPVVFS